MNEILHADLFFLITAVAVIVVGIALAALLFQVFVILRAVREIVENVRKASGSIEEDFESLRTEVKGEGKRVKTVLGLALGFLTRRFLKSRVRRKKKISTGE
ncbi:MAG TPA: hypothetical protein VD967_03085 [Candidatus Paceibacterota bacterium]|nr:hypothetical protein [Candidatus Paceibacterota bacterium]